MKTQQLPATTDVLIVGAGPTGMALAIALQQAGIDYLLIDKLQQGQNTSRAAVIHAHTLEMLDSLGVSKDLIERGMKLSKFGIRDRDKELLQLKFDQLPSTHACLLMLPQDVTEATLGERLAALGGSIHRGVTATGMQQTSGGVRVALETDAGESVVNARYVVGGDGMHSIVRTAAGIDFEGESYSDSFVLADVEMDWSLGKEEVSLFFAPEGLVVVAPLPNGRFRIVATTENAPEHPSVKDIQDLLDQRGPTTGRKTIKSVAWGSRFRIHHRVAKSYRNGRFFLMGDAAHVHSPAGGQGMNTGLVDAVVLGQLLSSVLQGKRPESALDMYQDMRRPAAAKVLELAGMLTNLATARGSFRRTVRNIILSVVNRIPQARRRLSMNLSGLSRKAFAVVPQA